MDLSVDKVEVRVTNFYKKLSYYCDSARYDIAVDRPSQA